MQHFSYLGCASAGLLPGLEDRVYAGQPKKTPADYTLASGIHFLKNLQVFQRKNRLTRLDQVKRR